MRTRTWWFWFLAGAWVAMAQIALSALTGCGDNLSVPPGPVEPFERESPCIALEALMRPASDAGAEIEVPSIEPADFGIRIIVTSDFNPFMGASYVVPGGRMVWNVWVYHWFDGDYLGAIGRVHARSGDPRGGMCRWYDPL